jgi:hypothetical protein
MRKVVSKKKQQQLAKALKHVSLVGVDLCSNDLGFSHHTHKQDQKALAAQGKIVIEEEMAGM